MKFLTAWWSCLLVTFVAPIFASTQNLQVSCESGLSYHLASAPAVVPSNASPVVRGKKGPRGAKGEVGERGERGATGEQGLKGWEGEKGEKGSEGLRGSKGEKGESNEKFREEIETLSAKILNLSNSDQLQSLQIQNISMLLHDQIRINREQALYIEEQSGR